MSRVKYVRPRAANRVRASTVSPQKVYRYRQARGTLARGDAAAVREHVAGLVSLGLTPEAVARAARVSPTVVGALLRGHRDRLDFRTAAALSKVTHLPHPNQAVCLTVGAARRAYALATMGWPLTWVAGQVGLTPGNLSSMLRHPRMSYRYWVAVRDLYERHAHLEGPSEIARQRARKNGWAPPLAWDDDTIDDPATQPEGVGFRRSRLRDGVEHGRESGARAHQRAGERPCGDCLRAANRAAADRRVRRAS